VELSTASHGHAIVIAITGRLDGTTAPEFETRILDLIAQGHRRIIVDLTGLGYISSAGLRVLLVAEKRLKPQAGRLLLSAPGGLVSKVLGAAGFEEILETYATLDEALARAEK
jgi:anti-sigma B factor antagonist